MKILKSRFERDRKQMKWLLIKYIYCRKLIFNNKYVGYQF